MTEDNSRECPFKEVNGHCNQGNAGGINEIVPQSFRLAVQQLINNFPWEPELVQST